MRRRGRVRGWGAGGRVCGSEAPERVWDVGGPRGIVRGGPPSCEGSLLAGLVCDVTLRARISHLAGPASQPFKEPLRACLRSPLEGRGEAPSKGVVPRGGTQGSRCTSAHRAQVLPGRVQGRPPCSRGRTAEELRAGRGWHPGLCHLGQGQRCALESVPGFRSHVCPLLTICPWARDCVSQPGFPHLDDGHADSTRPAGGGH